MNKKRIKTMLNLVHEMESCPRGLQCSTCREALRLLGDILREELDE